MADLKISQLPAATTPLTGVEILPIVQSSTTDKVAVSDLTAGRTVSMAGATVTGLTASKAVFTDASKNLTSTGTVGVTQGGSGTSTAFTLGSVVITGASGVYTQDNSYFFYDVSNTRLGLGTNTPNRRLELAGLTGGPALRLTNTNGNSGIEILTTATKFSWLLGAQYNVDQTFEITNSTANGGTTFSTPLFTINGSTGDIGFKVGNLIQGTAAKGVDFSANTPAAGKTSTLLNWYEEGTWTPAQGSGLTVVGAFSSSGTYTRIGRQVTVIFSLSGATSIAASAGGILTNNLPFTSIAGNNSAGTIYRFGAAGGQCIAGNTSTTVYNGAAIGAGGGFDILITYFV